MLYFIEIQGKKAFHGIAVVDRVFHRFIRQIEPQLKQKHPEYDFDLTGWAASFPGQVIWAHNIHPFRPRENLIHLLQEFFPLRGSPPVAVFHIREIELLVHPLHLNSIIPYPLF